MAAVTNPLLILPAVAGLLALTQTAGDAAFNLENHFAHNASGMPQLPTGAGFSKAPDGSPVLLRVGTPKKEEKKEEKEHEAAPLSCLQIQTIDEVELIDEPTPPADCD